MVKKTIHGFVLSYSEILFLYGRYARNCLLPIIEISKFIHFILNTVILCNVILFIVKKK